MRKQSEKYGFGLALVVLCGVSRAGAGDFAEMTRPGDSRAETTLSYAVRLPALDSETCAEQADSLKNRFEAATGLQVTQAKCNGTETLSSGGIDYVLSSLELDYQAESRPELHSALFGEPAVASPEPGGVAGVYSSYSDCLFDIGPQSDLFKKQTGLLAVASFCDPADVATGGHFLLEIDGFGTPLASLYVFDPGFSGDAAIESQLRSVISSQGAVLAKVVGSLHFYYAQTPLNLQTDLLGTFPSQAECSSQIGDAQAIFTQAGAATAWVFCLPSDADGGVGFTLESVRDASAYVARDYAAGSRSYLSLAECLGDRARAIQATGLNVYGGLCAPSETQDGVYVLELFESL